MIELLKKNFNDKIFFLFDRLFFDPHDRREYIRRRKIDRNIFDEYIFA